MCVAGTPEAQPKRKKRSEVLGGSSEVLSSCAVFRRLSEGIRDRGEPDMVGIGTVRDSTSLLRPSPRGRSDI
jgi:hypothetical protein